MLAYLHWQFFAAPAWTARLAANLQKALARYFSIPVMLRTLISHWHKDAVQYRGTISQRLLALAWNLISRGIGLLIRSTIILLWLITAAVLLAASAFSLAIFFLWPLAVVAGILWPLMTLLP